MTYEITWITASFGWRAATGPDWNGSSTGTFTDLFDFGRTFNMSYETYMLVAEEYRAEIDALPNVTVTGRPEPEADIDLLAWTLPSIASQGDLITPVVTIRNNGLGSVIKATVGGTSTAGDTITSGFVERALSAWELLDIPCPISLAAAKPGTYTIFPDIYLGDALVATSTCKTIVIGESEDPEPGDDEMECNTPTAHFSSGCALLKHYDADGDGIVRSVDALIAQGDGMTSEEVTFILTASTRGSIDAMCPGCYSPAEPSSKSAWLVLGAALIGLYLYLKG